MKRPWTGGETILVKKLLKRQGITFSSKLLARYYIYFKGGEQSDLVKPKIWAG